MMLSYKEHIFLSIIDTVNLQESYNQGDTSFLEMLLEAPMDDKTANKIIADKKRLSVYYQGDEKSKKGWYSIEPIRIDNKNGKNFILTYIIPKDGSKPVLQYLNQSKIVNWNVLGKKDAELPKEYEKKVLKFLSDPKIPKENKKSLLDKLKATGVKVKDFAKKAAVGAAVVGTLLMPFKDNIKQYLRQQAPHVAQLYNTKNLNAKDFRTQDLKMMGSLISQAIKDKQRYGEGNKKISDENQGAVTYDQYREEVRSDLLAGEMLNGKQMFNQLTQDPEVLIGLTLGKFAYQKNSDGSYTITDTYDFSKWKSIKTTKEDIKDLTYPEAIVKIMSDNDQGLYGAIRHMAYLETPDDVPGVEAKKINVVIPASYVTNYDLTDPSYKTD
jgi:hypothetical protein